MTSMIRNFRTHDILEQRSWVVGVQLLVLVLVAEELMVLVVKTVEAHKDC
jgi:hypothetical protein